MINSLYLAADAPPQDGLLWVQTGYGFAPDGSFLSPEPLTGTVVVNDRFLPSAAGLKEAEVYFQRIAAVAVVCDFEQPLSDAFAQLVCGIGAQRAVVPPQYAALPHRAVFLPPYVPVLSYPVWLRRAQEAYGSLWLDLAPLRLQRGVGGAARSVPLSRLPPGEAHFSEALCCMYLCRCEAEGTVFSFFDTASTYRLRLERSGCPCLIPAREYRALLSNDAKSSPSG